MTPIKRKLNLKLLIVDDDKNICRALGLSLKDTKCQLVTAHSVDDAIAKIRTNSFDLVLTDYKMQDKTGMDLIREAKTLKPDISIVVMTAYASIENVIATMKEGAYDYLPKPFTNDYFIHFLNRIQNLVDLKRENENLKKPWIRRNFFSGLTSPASRSLEEFVRKMAPSEAPILLTGESGTGKSELAKLIHELSPRASGPFITDNCTNSSEPLQQLNSAEGGTLFLDEISDLSPQGQAKLLRFLQDKLIEGTHVDTRIIAATNKDLQEAVEEGKFREDLYYRLNTLETQLVSLRHRNEDIPVHIDRFLHEFKTTEGLSDIPRVPQDVMDKMLNYRWPGNLRELRNTIQRLIMLSKGRQITLDDLPPAFRQDPKGVSNESPFRPLDEVEKKHILALLEHETNLERAAEILGITKATLWRKRKQYGLI